MEKELTRTEALGKLVYLIIVGVLVAFIFLGISIYFGYFIYLSVDSAKALVETIATILGFYGLIAVYLLTSYDNRIDKLEEKLIDATKTKVEKIGNLQRRIKDRKRIVSYSIILGLCCLFASLFLAIITLSCLTIENPTETAFQIATGTTVISCLLLFTGLLSIVGMIYRISREPE